MAFQKALLAPNPAPSGALAQTPVPGMVLLNSIKVTEPNTASPNLANIIVDAPSDATFAKYRKFLFQFYGIGVSGAADAIVTFRHNGVSLANSVYYQLNATSSAAATGWINSAATGSASLTSGTPITTGAPINSLDIWVHPVGFDAYLQLGSTATLPLAAMWRSTGTFTQNAANQAQMPLSETPGVILAPSANLFQSWLGQSSRAMIGITCDVYGMLIK